ncbi:MAG: mandelate racemase/muconate lactonizing enzyme family protein [Pseudomonadota bacterium]|nr:mandelate racemase/muconate lactonizing enzyme family protein [Pseudomonadota bacterium]
MKITSLDVFQLDLPYAGGTYRLSHGRDYDSFDATYVRLRTDTGLEGWGESTPFGATYIAAHARGVRAGIEEMATGVLGRDPRLTDRVWDAMDQHLAGHNHAKAAVDLAVWDLAGKALGLPVHALLGGATGQRMTVISSIHAGSPEDMRARVADHRARGYRGHSIKIGASDAEGGPALDAERIRAALDGRQTGEFFLVDANGGLSPEQALRLLNLLPAGLDFVLEAPCASWREMLSLRRRCSVPIMLDELVLEDSDLVHMISTDAADGLGLKITKAGGLTPSRRQRDICRAAGLVMSVQDTVGSTLSFAALAHLGSTVPPHLLRCILDVRDMVTLPVGAIDAPIRDGGILLGDAPGLGVEIDASLFPTPVASYSL